MHQFSIYVLFAICSLPVFAVAAENRCGSIPELKDYDMNGCDCGKNISKLKVKSPKGMSLIAACNYEKVEFVGMVGEFYFKGKTTFIGEVSHTIKPDSGESVLFNAKTPDQPDALRKIISVLELGVKTLLSVLKLEDNRVISSLKFDANSSGIQKFKFTPLTEEANCWITEAAINVNLLYVQAGEFSDEEENIPKAYEVLKTGEYRQCKKPDVAPSMTTPAISETSPIAVMPTSEVVPTPENTPATQVAPSSEVKPAPEVAPIRKLMGI